MSNSVGFSRAGSLGILTLAMALVVVADSPRSQTTSSLPSERSRTATNAIKFEVNAGQVGSHVDLFARCEGYAVAIASRALLFDADDAGTVGMEFVGARTDVFAAGELSTPTVHHYYKGRDRSKWLRDVPTFERARCDELYEGIDLVCRGSGSVVAYDFHVKPGADPSSIEIRFSHADRVHIDIDGVLKIETENGRYSHSRPVAFQGQDSVTAMWERRGQGRFGIRLGAYDTARALVIDPTVRYATTVGGTGHETALDLGASPDYALIMVGPTTSPDFIGGNAGSHAGGNDVFVSRVNETGSAVDFTVFLGGSGDDRGLAVALDKFANIYVAGFTTSTDFATLDPLISNFAGGTYDGIVAKFDIDGNLIYSTYLGGPKDEWAKGIDVTADGDAYVIGDTLSRRDFGPIAIENPVRPFSTVAAFEPDNHRADAYLVKLDPSGALDWWTFYGGIADEQGRDVAVGPNDDVFIVGRTNSADLPLASSDPNGPVRTQIELTDAFVARLGATDGAILYSTYIGGDSLEEPWDIDVDFEGNATICGRTFSTNLTGAVAGSLRGTTDAFVLQLGPLGSTVGFSYYLGGDGHERAEAVAVDFAGNVYVTGLTDGGAGFPIVNALQPNYGGSIWDSFLTKIDKSGTILYSSYFGGVGQEENKAVIVDNRGTVYLAGESIASFPEVNPVQTIQPGFNCYLAVFDFDEDGDGLPDVWERHPFTAINGETVDLASMGADPLRKDIFVEIGYMKGRRPAGEAIDAIVAAFAAAPLDNPDSTTGITLHVAIKEHDVPAREIPFATLLGGESNLGQYEWQGANAAYTYLQDIKDHPDYGFTQGLLSVSRYCLFANRIRFGDTTSSGIARPGSLVDEAGNDFIVSLDGIGIGGVGSVNQQAGTFMHELGHTLGLKHGGADAVNRKPNYLSVMNYYFQENGLVHSGAGALFDYSRTKLPDLNENALNESVGLNGGLPVATLGTKWFCFGSGVQTTASANGSIDWNCSGGENAGTIAADLNGDGAPAPPFSPGSIFVGHDDWGNIVFNGGAVGDLGTILFPPDPSLGASLAPDEITAGGSFRLPAPERVRGRALKRGNFLHWKPRRRKNRQEGLKFNVYRTVDGMTELLQTTRRSWFWDHHVVSGTTYTYSITLGDEFGTQSAPVILELTSK